MKELSQLIEKHLIIYFIGYFFMGIFAKSNIMKRKNKTKRKKRLYKKHHSTNRSKKKKNRRRFSYKPIKKRKKIKTNHATTINVEIPAIHTIDSEIVLEVPIPLKRKERPIDTVNTVSKSPEESQDPIPHNHDKGDIGEKFVSELTSKSYITYWCYPNPVDEEGDKKEICDLLIAFFDTAIIISVKNYDNKGNYERYKRKVIEKSTNQLFGAERKLFNSNRNIKIKHPERGEFVFIPSDYKHVYRITVNAGEQFEKYELIDNQNNKGCINIFNKETFETIISELDTIKDLIEYLSIREELFIKNANVPIHCSEKDLLAHYLMNNREFPDDCFNGNFEEWNKSCVDKWDVYLSSRSVLLKKLADENSYFIDELIKTDVLPLENGEKMAEILMTLSRFERRNIANNLFEIVQKYQGTENDFSRRHHIDENGTLFLYVYYSPKQKSEEVDKALGRTAKLYGYKFKPKRILYLAATDNLKQWKFGLTEFGDDEFENLTQDQIDFYENVITMTGWFSNMTMSQVENKEYPDER